MLQVFIVAGGTDDGKSFLSSTEMLIGEDARAWTWGGNLPLGRYGAIGVSVANRFLLIGKIIKSKFFPNIIIVVNSILILNI